MELFSPYYYYSVFLFLMLGFVIFQSNKLTAISNSTLLLKNNNNYFFLSFVFLFVFVAGLRPVSNAFADTVNYAFSYRLMAEGYAEAVDMNSDRLFGELMYWFASRNYDIMWFFLLVEILYIVPMVIACKRQSSNNYILLLIFCFSAFSFYSYGINGIRNGMACSLVILALTYLQGNKRDKIICGVLCFFAYNFHHSTALPIVAMLYSNYFSKPKHMFYLWVASIGISLVMGGVVENFFTNLGFDDRMDSYISGQEDEEEMSLFSQTGFRWDFLLYSAMPIWLGWYLVFKRKIYNSTYMLLLGTYIYSNAFWVMVIRAAYSNRFAYLSWFLYPIVLAYPLVKFEIWPKQGEKTAKILLTFFGFTFLMWILGKQN